ncbi:hypothetical protein [Robertkochia sediminum]|uniref:hypothetical protein n=1 Tax=Robertkochia sediminum TaxID=2785326 RepID=UPI001932A061|nr:hypothetical protein [Robertkochia sediminum]MBL7473041.1 hypothetical protein [Robertkochia sediminum]
MDKQIFQARLFSPTLPSDFIHRERLEKRLNLIDDIRLVLISAPSGYGKCLLTSGWLEQSEHSWCWINLNSMDGDLNEFSLYLIHAIRSLIPDFGTNTLEILSTLNNLTKNEKAHTHFKHKSADTSMLLWTG